MTELFSLPYNLLLMKGSAMAANSVGYNTPLWCVTHIILFLPIIVILMQRFRAAYKYILCWFVPIMLYAYNVEHVGKMAIWDINGLLCLRNIAGMMLGTAAFYLVRALQKKRTETQMKVIRGISVAAFAEAE